MTFKLLRKDVLVALIFVCVHVHVCPDVALESDVPQVEQVLAGHLNYSDCCKLGPVVHILALVNYLEAEVGQKEDLVFVFMEAPVLGKFYVRGD